MELIRTVMLCNKAVCAGLERSRWQLSATHAKIIMTSTSLLLVSRREREREKEKEKEREW
jgi:hypothetical protein